jgi:enoyl-[acyl-carrier protein] reductase II
MSQSIASLFGIRYPIIQGGMIWCSGWKLTAAVSKAGGLGLIGAGSMYPDVFREHIRKTFDATDKPFGVNVPLLYPQTEELMQIILEEKVPIVFTSAGNPAKYTRLLKENGIRVAHVVPSARLAVKCEAAGVDAVVAEGFEAGGHNGREETTTMALIPLVRKKISIPLIAAGGIGSGQAILAAFALGADGVQIGSLFAASAESSAHPAFKESIVKAGEGDTMLSLKKVVPVRLLRNPFFEQIHTRETEGASADELAAILGRGRAKQGMFEGDTEEGELEIGQVSAQIDNILPVKQIMQKLLQEYQTAKMNLSDM